MRTPLVRKGRSTPPPDAPEFKPSRILEVELSQPVPEVPALEARTGRRYEHARALVRLHSQPLGLVDLPLGAHGLSAPQCARAIWDALAPQIGAHLRADGQPPVQRLDVHGLPPVGPPACLQDRQRVLAQAPLVSVVLATRDGTARLAACLDSLLALEYPCYEVIVVDNAPRTAATADLLRQRYAISAVRYVREERPGLSWARNRGLLEARGDLVAFTDDDVVVDRFWLAELARGFGLGAHVACVTGNVLPLELETPAQIWFEQFGGFSKGFERRIFDTGENRPDSPLFPYAAGMFGSGNNMAFRTTVLRALGGFDPALGAGSLVGGEDMKAFFQVITRGLRLVYEPGALTYHVHRRDYEGLRKQLYHYGTGLSGYLLSEFADQPALLPGFMAKVPYNLFVLVRGKSMKTMARQGYYPRDLRNVEVKGMVDGLLGYVRSRRRARTLEKQAGLLDVGLTRPVAKNDTREDRSISVEEITAP
jgi:glycosyltransferase involved in cell wall biosynthesis